jgi:hypothetical protein
MDHRWRLVFWVADAPGKGLSSPRPEEGPESDVGLMHTTSFPQQFIPRSCLNSLKLLWGGQETHGMSPTRQSVSPSSATICTGWGQHPTGTWEDGQDWHFYKSILIVWVTHIPATILVKHRGGKFQINNVLSIHSLLLLCWGYIVLLTKVLTVCHRWIHRLRYSPFSIFSDA